MNIGCFILMLIVAAQLSPLYKKGILSIFFLYSSDFFHHSVASPFCELFTWRWHKVKQQHEAAAALRTAIQRKPSWHDIYSSTLTSSCKSSLTANTSIIAVRRWRTTRPENLPSGWWLRWGRAVGGSDRGPAQPGHAAPGLDSVHVPQHLLCCVRGF